MVAGQVHGGHDDDHVLAAGVGVEMDLAAHHLGHVHGGGDGAAYGGTVYSVGQPFIFPDGAVKGRPGKECAG